MSDQETIFIDGMWFKKPHENAKDFVKGKLSINLEQFAPFIKKYEKDGWLNIDRGELVKPDKCSECGTEGRIDGHHEDYSKPLEVMWLCGECHRKRHKQFQRKYN